ncbi:MAG: hypothetical protein DWG83_01825 [Chloroflexi bacterium]|nr:hypothetical protein [Chloroflexota bacterium]
MNLDAVRARVRADLRDPDPPAERWDDEALDRHIARTVQELSLAAPREATVTLEAPGGTRELAIEGLDDRVSIEAVEWPVGRYPAAFVPFSTWGDTLTLLTQATPAAGAEVIVRYSALHALDAEGSTLPEALGDLVATGAAAYAAIEWASYATNRVNAGGDDTWRRYHTWGQERLAAFARSLAKHGRERRLKSRRLYVAAAAGAGARGIEG